MINLIQPLPFFDRLQEQDRFKENCSAMYRFLCKPDKLIPFQIRVPLNADSIDSIKIIGASHAFEVELSNGNENQFKFISSTKNKWLVFFGNSLKFVRESGLANEDLILCSDFYYFQITVNGVTKYSEVFYVIGEGLCDQPITMEIEAWHDKNIMNYTFDQGFKFKAYFNSFITNITPDITDEFSKDGYERQILQRRVIQFTHNVELDPMPNSVSIGIAAITAFKNIVIKHNGNTYPVKDITYKRDEVEGGALDTILLAFSIFDEDIIRTNC